MDLLDSYCTVIYYHLEKEDNNGFHTNGISSIDEKEEHFVFINTAQTMEKQVFTAAHELGHVWKVDDYVIENCGEEITVDDRESIINRFAATLMMPVKEFRDAYSRQYLQVKGDDIGITVLNMLYVIAYLMNQFFVPYKAVVMRLGELNIFAKKTVQLFLGEAQIKQGIIHKKLDEIIAEKGYIKFQNPSKKKWIDGLSEILDKAEIEQSVSVAKIDVMRKEFGLNKKSANKEVQEIIDVQNGEMTNENYK